MILRLHHHRDIWQRWKLKAPGPGILLGAWSERCQLWGRGDGGGRGGALWTGFCIAVSCSIGFPSQPQKLPLPV